MFNSDLVDFNKFHYNLSGNDAVKFYKNTEGHLIAIKPEKSGHYKLASLEEVVDIFKNTHPHNKQEFEILKDNYDELQKKVDHFNDNFDPKIGELRADTLFQKALHYVTIFFSKLGLVHKPHRLELNNIDLYDKAEFVEDFHKVKMINMLENRLGFRIEIVPDKLPPREEINLTFLILRELFVSSDFNKNIVIPESFEANSPLKSQVLNVSNAIFLAGGAQKILDSLSNIQTEFGDEVNVERKLTIDGYKDFNIDFTPILKQKSDEKDENKELLEMDQLVLHDETIEKHFQIRDKLARERALEELGFTFDFHDATISYYENLDLKNKIFEYISFHPHWKKDIKTWLLPILGNYNLETTYFSPEGPYEIKCRNLGDIYGD